MRKSSLFYSHGQINFHSKIKLVLSDGIYAIGLLHFIVYHLQSSCLMVKIEDLYDKKNLFLT